MRKKDLKYGNVVELRNGERFLYTRNITIAFVDIEFIKVNDDFHWFHSNEINDELKNAYGVSSLDIMKVYEDYTCSKLLWERKEKPKLTDDEKVILRSLDKKFKWIFRDNDDYGLGVSENKPFKEGCEHCWYVRGCNTGASQFPYKHLFQFIKWEDDEPYLIEDLLNGDE